MDLKKILTGLLSKAYKVDEGRITEILEKTDEKEVLADLLELDKERVAALKPNPEEGKTKFQEGYKKAKSEVLSAFEKELKDATGIESDLTGTELIEHIVSTKAAEAVASKGGKKPEEMTEEDFKKTPVYRKAEKEFRKQLEDQKVEWEGKLSDAEKGFNRAKTVGSFNEFALKELDGLKPILSKDATRARNQKESFLKQLLAEGLEVSFEDGEFVLLKDGKAFTDAHGNHVKPKEFVTARANDFFDFEANNGGSNSGNANDKGGKNDGAAAGGTKKEYPAGITKPATFEDFQKIVGDKSIPLADRQAVSEAWQTENGRI